MAKSAQATPPILLESSLPKVAVAAPGQNTARTRRSELTG